VIAGKHPSRLMLPPVPVTDKAVERLARQIEAELFVGRVASNLKKDRALTARLRAAMSAKAKAQAAHDQLVKMYGTQYCHHGTATAGQFPFWE